MVKHVFRDIYDPTMSKIWLGNRSTCQIVYVKDFRVTITQLITTPYPTHKSHPAKNNKKHPLKRTQKRVLCPLASCIFCFISFISSREPTCDLKEHKRKPTVRKYLSNLWLGLIRQPNVFLWVIYQDLPTSKRTNPTSWQFLEDDDEFDPPKIKACLYLKDPDMS